mmetsp:Transcript_97417/g.313875  ORF Transcript_97417/g.313875 Transcript_97417/m.313875 type:complete len:392 (-) Transcript_97417:237-1412(-)
MTSVLARRVAASAVRRLPQGGRPFSFLAAVEGEASCAARSRVLFGAAAAAAAAAVAGCSLKERAVCAEGNVDLAELDKRVRELEVTQAERMHSAFVFIKPHAVTDSVKKLVTERFAAEGLGIKSEGVIASEKIDKELLIDTHYGAIAARAMMQKPSELVVQQKAQDEFEKAFGMSWSDAVAKGLVYNLVNGAAKLGCSMDDLGDKYDKLSKGKDLLKFGGGFYCGKVDGVYVINGFYAKMRSEFTVPGECIYYYEVEWDPNRLSWGDFRGKLLGGTDPKTADASSLRNAIYKNWKDLELTSEPTTGKNGMHASASPFEALAERVNWLGRSIEGDCYGKALVALGVPVATVSAWSQDPAVTFQGKKQSLFDLLEDLNSAECLKKSVAILGGK